MMQWNELARWLSGAHIRFDVGRFDSREDWHDNQGIPERAWHARDAALPAVSPRNAGNQAFVRRFAVNSAQDLQPS
jgi:hypothetical protein